MVRLRRNARCVAHRDVSGVVFVMHLASVWYSHSMIKGSDLAVVPCRTVPKSSLPASMRHRI
jgi:hypothetical protein